MLASALRRRGVDVALLAQAVDEEVEASGMPVRHSAAWPTNVGGVLSFASAVRSAVAAGSGTVLSFDRIPGVPYIRAGDGCHAAYLESMGQEFLSRFSPKHRVLLSLERGAFTSPNLKRIIANSKMVADELRRRYAVPEEKIRVVPTGLSNWSPPGLTRDDARSELGLSAAGRIFLFAGHNFERKGLDTLIRALGLLDEKGRPMILVAGRGDRNRHESLAAELGVGGSVRFLGPADLSRVFPAADLFVLPTRYDPLARVCLEAAAAGLPVLTTRRNGFSEWIAPDAGFLLDSPEDAPALAELMRSALNRDLPAMGRTQLSRVRHLTIDKNAEEICSCLSD